MLRCCGGLKDNFEFKGYCVLTAGDSTLRVFSFTVISYLIIRYLVRNLCFSARHSNVIVGKIKLNPESKFFPKCRVWPDFLASNFKFILAFEEIGPFPSIKLRVNSMRSGQALIGFKLGLFWVCFFIALSRIFLHNPL